MAGAAMPALVRTLQPLPPPLLLEWRSRRRRRQHVVVVVVAAAEMAVVHRRVRQHYHSHTHSLSLSFSLYILSPLGHSQPLFRLAHICTRVFLPLFLINSVSLSVFTGAKRERFSQ